MSFKGPQILKLNGGLGQTAPSDRNVAGLIFANGYTVGTTFEFNKVYELNSLDDAEALGLSAASDANGLTISTALCYYHISEFFRLNPNGKLFVSNNEAFSPTTVFTNGIADALMAASDKRIRFIGLVFGVAPGATVTITNNMWSGVYSAIDAGQAWITTQADAFVFIDTLVVEGFAFGIGQPFDLKTLEAPQVSVTIGHDRSYLQGLVTTEPLVASTCAVGTVLASIGVRMLSESAGSVRIERLPDEKRGQENYTLVDTRTNRWLRPYMSNDVSFEGHAQSNLNEYTANGYIYAGRYVGYQGVYLNADPTCTTVVDDFNTIHLNRIWNETARRVRRALIPRMNSRVQIDPTSGKIKVSTLADWDAAAKRELNALLAEGEISDFRFTMDPNQDVIAQGKVLVKVSIVPQGIAKSIEAEIGFNNPAQ
jgi:hypothetical protein